jgi:hypothetical protein
MPWPTKVQDLFQVSSQATFEALMKAEKNRQTRFEAHE